MSDTAITAIIESIWNELNKAATSRSPFNFLQLATSGLDGAPQLRTIVLRQSDVEKGTLSFVTDIRSPKVAEIRSEPRVALVGFDPQRSLQLRLSGKALLVEDAQARRDMWERLREKTLLLFEAPFAPGTPIDTTGAAIGTAEEELEPVDPFSQFVLVMVTLSRVEWLDLSSENHMRFAFDRTDSSWHGTRLAP